MYHRYPIILYINTLRGELDAPLQATVYYLHTRRAFWSMPCVCLFVIKYCLTRFGESGVLLLQIFKFIDTFPDHIAILESSELFWSAFGMYANEPRLLGSQSLLSCAQPSPPGGQIWYC